MKTSRLVITRILASLAIATSLITASTPALSQPNTGGGPSAMDDGTRQAHMKERMQTRLDDMAKRLKIESSQQSAWNDYAKTVQSTFDMKFERPATDADAATIIRARAKMATDHAQKMMKLADATEKLQNALNPEQRKALTEIVREQGRSPNDRQKRHLSEKPRAPQ